MAVGAKFSARASLCKPFLPHHRTVLRQSAAWRGRGGRRLTTHFSYHVQLVAHPHVETQSDLAPLLFGRCPL
eukprot:67190-Prymnesium_polylepis.2